MWPCKPASCNHHMCTHLFPTSKLFHTSDISYVPFGLKITFSLVDGVYSHEITQMPKTNELKLENNNIFNKYLY